MPSISVEGDMSELVNNLELVETLEQCVINWLGQISYALESQMKKKPQVFCAGLEEPDSGYAHHPRGRSFRFRLP